ncbi:unannotated protein [freshwater metagenome]|uniref:Unannotated protein n=1 Tax=freshwater metagenome TaxID=449393 RepID=A0A6J7CU64_9ZZZZ|nr:hypothetical protein [Actinomycetota bacterium]
MSESAEQAQAALERLERIETQLDLLREEVARARDEVAAAFAAPPVSAADEEGARLVALDLVLAGTQRAVAMQRLQESFPGIDAGAALDAAAATLGG